MQDKEVFLKNGKAVLRERGEPHHPSRQHPQPPRRVAAAHLDPNYAPHAAARLLAVA